MSTWKCFCAIHLHSWTYISNTSVISFTHTDCLNLCPGKLRAVWAQDLAVNKLCCYKGQFVFVAMWKTGLSGCEKSEGEWEKAQTQKTVVRLIAASSCWRGELKPSCVRRSRPVFEAIFWLQCKFSYFCGIRGITTGTNLSKKATIVVTLMKVQ